MDLCTLRAVAVDEWHFVQSANHHRGLVALPAYHLACFLLCSPSRQCSPGSTKQAESQSGKRAQGEDDSAERYRRKWSGVYQSRERSGQANYAISGQRAK